MIEKATCGVCRFLHASGRLRGASVLNAVTVINGTAVCHNHVLAAVTPAQANAWSALP